jgi:hypothetical protein
MILLLDHTAGFRTGLFTIKQSLLNSSLLVAINIVHQSVGLDYLSSSLRLDVAIK